MRHYIISLDVGLLSFAGLLAASQTVCSVSYSDCINSEVSVSGSLVAVTNGLINTSVLEERANASSRELVLGINEKPKEKLPVMNKLLPVYSVNCQI